MPKDLREERKEIFEETKRLYTTNKQLVDSVTFSKEKHIEFAVYCSPRDTKNYDVFKQILSSICK